MLLHNFATIGKNMGSIIGQMGSTEHIDSKSHSTGNIDSSCCSIIIENCHIDFIIEFKLSIMDTDIADIADIATTVVIGRKISVE